MNKHPQELTQNDMARYNRQMLIQGWGIEGQKKLKNSKVVVLGAGGLGCPASIYLAAGGIGHLVIIDMQKPELTNLNRQILHWEEDIKGNCNYKAVSAKEKIEKMNSDIRVEAVVAEINEKNIYDMVEGADVIIDAMDNFNTRYLINKACIHYRIPFVHAGICGLAGQLTTIAPGKGPCLKCIFPMPPDEQKIFPVLGTTPAMFATLQAMEAFKLILGIGTPLTGSLLIFDGEFMSFNVLKINRSESCDECSHL